MVLTIVALQRTMDLSIGIADIAYRMKHTSTTANMWGQVTGKGLFEFQPPMVCVDISIVAAFPKPSSSGENYFNQVHDRRAPDIPSTCHQAHSQANRTRGADNSHPVSGEQQSRLNPDFTKFTSSHGSRRIPISRYARQLEWQSRSASSIA